MSDNEDELWTAIIPVNVTQSKRIFGFKMRNIIEGVICALIVAALIRLVPFVFKVQVIVTVALSGSVLILNMLGIKGMSLTESLINFLMSRGSKKKYHLRSIRNAKKNQGFQAGAGKAAVFNESLAEKGVRKLKEFIEAKRQGTDGQ